MAWMMTYGREARQTKGYRISVISHHNPKTRKNICSFLSPCFGRNIQTVVVWLGRNHHHIITSLLGFLDTVVTFPCTCTFTPH